MVPEAPSVTPSVDEWPDALDAVGSEPLPPHTLENIGDRPLRALVVELKSPPDGGG